jgi:hypothetical protein
LFSLLNTTFDDDDDDDDDDDGGVLFLDNNNGEGLLLSWSVWSFVRRRDIAPLDGLITLPQHSSIAGDDNIVIIDARWHRF